TTSPGRARADVVSLLHRGRPLLLLFGARADRYRRQAAPWAGLLQTVRDTAPSDAPWEALLVRPDGYIAWAPGGGSLAEALTAYFGPPGPRGSAGGGGRTGRPPTAPVPPPGREPAVSSSGCP
ncbi:MAG TPA: hypothetical protein VIW71_18500, partial [Streptomyces sp.]